MGPKKGKKGGDGPNEDADKVVMLNNTVQQIQKQLMTEQQFADNNRAAENEIKQRVMYLERDLKAEKEKMVTITTAMTHQYKQMQKQYNDELASLLKKIAEREDQLKQNNELIAATKKQQDQRLKAKQAQIVDLKKKIEQMSAQFAKMLKQTLEKMQQRINLAQWDNDNDPSMIKKMKQMNNMS